MKLKKSNVLKALIISVLMVFISACSVSDSDMKSHASDVIQDSFSKEIKEANEKTIIGSLYVPFLMSINSVSPNNIILEQGSQTYILFNNSHESDDSKEMFNTLVENNESIILDHTYEQDGKFSYLVVEEMSEEQVVLTVGIGGKKMTTETTAKDVISDIETMIEILRSFEPISQPK